MQLFFLFVCFNATVKTNVWPIYIDLENIVNEKKKLRNIVWINVLDVLPTLTHLHPHNYKTETIIITIILMINIYINIEKRMQK